MKRCCLIFCEKQVAAAHCGQSLGKSADFRLRFTTPRQASSEKVHLVPA